MNDTTYEKALKAGLEKLISVEPEVTKYDTVVGDGDCGTGMKRGAEAVLHSMQQSRPSTDLVTNMTNVVHAVENSMDGTSGALFCIFLNSLVSNLRAQDNSSHQQVTPQIWAKALGESLHDLQKYTPAKPGDRTLIDALAPFVGTLSQTSDVLQAGKAARAGAEATKGMKASLGRSVYVGGDSWRDVPDPGAYGLASLLTGIVGAL